ncbi:MAG: hypothetical protein H6735_12030 [Alphaproteobacteria bacterium]|nr:hypothetical protein [Alphaproteobacteria bacterium]
MTLLWLVAATALAQRADEPWRTVRTEHFTVHYPLAAEPWTLETVGRMEELHARVVEEVGYEDGRRVRVRVANPYGLANGFALPFLGHPRIELWATAPEASSVIGHYRSWGELLLVHEDAHVVHLTRPSRNPARSAIDAITGLGPLATGAPRWVMEGYATVVEGRLTGLGRPNGDYRPTYLRGLALAGALPDYDELSGNERFLGGSDAYLVGSAYLEWLSARAGEDALRQLWRRMSAREVRTFDDAFTGVFGEPPAVLYGRFSAELTADAVLAARAEGDPPGALFQAVRGAVSAVSLSPDGSSVVATGRNEAEGTWVKVWALAPDEEAQRKREEAVARALERDPLDVAPVPPTHPPHEVLHQLHLRGWMVRDVSFLPDGDQVVLTAGRTDGSGRLRWDLFEWNLASGRLRRVTRRADVRSPDATPDGAALFAVRQDWGRTELVRVERATGEVTPLALGEPGVALDGPRVSPDGAHVAWLESRREGWSAVVAGPDGEDRLLLPANRRGGAVTQLAWTPDGALLGVVGEEGGLDVVTLWRDGLPVGRREASLPGGILAMDATADEVLAVTLGPLGQDLVRLPLTADGLPAREPAPPPVGRPPTPTAAPELPSRIDLTPEPYGLGPMEAWPLIAGGGTTAGDAGQLELGVRVGDVVGRTEALLVGAIPANTGGAGGGRLGLALRVLPVTTTGDVWMAGDDRLGTRRIGTMLGASGTWRDSNARVTVRSGALVDRPLDGDEHPGRDLVSAQVGGAWREGRARGFGLSASTGGQAGRLGTDELWTVEGAVGGWAFDGIGHVAASYRRGRSNRGGIGGFALGGVQNTVVPDLAEAFRVMDPAFAPGTAWGTDHDELEVSVGAPISVVALRHRVGGAELGPRGYTSVGLRVEQAVDAQPFVRVPASSLGLGVACRVEGPGLGLQPQACQHVEDWAAWGWLSWDVGR